MKLKAKQPPAKSLREAPGRKGMSLEMAEKWLTPNLEE